MDICYTAINGVGSNQPICSSTFTDIPVSSVRGVNPNSKHINQPLAIFSIGLSIVVLMVILFKVPEPVL